MKSSTTGYKPLGGQDSLRFSASLMFKNNSLFIRVLLWHRLLGKILWVSLLGVKVLPLLLVPCTLHARIQSSHPYEAGYYHYLTSDGETEA